MFTTRKSNLILLSLVRINFVCLVTVIPQVMKRMLFSISERETTPLHATHTFHARMEPP